MDGPPRTPLEDRSRSLFDDSVRGLDMPLRSRLAQARHAALAQGPRRRLGRVPLWTIAVGATAASALGVAIWFGASAGRHAVSAADARPNLEDLEIVASSDQGSGDAMEMLQDDVEFYAWAAGRAEKTDKGNAG